jgi:hypothetical protein
MRLPLVGGAYTPRSIIANCQRCINLYPERNGNGAPVPLTHYQRPGLVPLIQGPTEPVRNVYRASNGNGYCTIGNTVYAISPSWQLQGLGTITPGVITPVSMVDNGATITVVDGSNQGWLIDMATNAFSVWSDSTGLMRGADRIDYIDGFLVMNVAGGNNNEFISTLLNTTVFDSTYFAFKTGYPDPLVSLIVNRNYIILLGALKSELWFNAGGPTFPFQMVTGYYYEHGLVAKYSLTSSDISVYFLGQDLQGQGIVWRIGGGDQAACKRISNHAIEYQIRKMANSVGIADAIGYTYQQDGHFFYVLHFPAGDQTWVYDDTLGAQDPDIAWHQECYTDPDTGALHRHRGNCHGFINGKNLVGDFENGTIYAMDLDVYTDTVDGIVCRNTYIRSFPHLGTGEVEIGVWGKRPVPADGRRVKYTAFMLDLECGLSTSNSPDTVALRYSDDRGRTYSSDILQTTGELGEYLTQPIWRGLGMARDRVFEVEYSTQGPATLNGAWVEGEVLET